MENQFRRPLGLVLQGGGALGAWQAGAMEALEKAGLAFDKILGFSAGALTGASYAFNRVDELLLRYREADRFPVLQFRPRLWPLHLFSGKPVWDATESVWDDEDARDMARCELIVMGLCLDDRLTRYWRFTPRGADGWDGPVNARLVASCAIPTIFPPVRIEEEGTTRTYIDGGIPGKEWMRMDALKGCRDVIVLEMVRHDEVGLRCWGPISYFDQHGRGTCRRQIDAAVEGAKSWPEPPRVFRVSPSRRITFTMLDYKSRYLAPEVERGINDGLEFLKNPAPFAAAVHPHPGAASRGSAPNLTPAPAGPFPIYLEGTVPSSRLESNGQ